MKVELISAKKLLSFSQRGRRGIRHSNIFMMPEGPEVRAMVDDIRTTLLPSEPVKWSLSKFQVLSGRYKLTDIPKISNLINVLPLNLGKIECKGKFIYFSFKSSYFFWSTLGLTGWWTFDSPERTNDNARIQLTFSKLDETLLSPNQSTSNQCDERNLFYYDQRNFGTFKISTDENELHEKLASLGYCWLTNRPTLQQFSDLLNNKRTQSKPLAVFLLNQKKTAGVGNYLLSEILYNCRLHPWVTCGQLSEEDKESLYWSTLSILVQSYLSQTDQISRANYLKSLDNEFIDGSDREKAIIQFVRQTFSMKVYMQINCPLGYKVRREEGPHKRTIHWVPQLQTKYSVS